MAIKACTAESVDWKILENGCGGHPEVSLSFNKNYYLLVTQDYCSKWIDAVPLLNQTADCMTVFASYGIPDIFHSN